MQAGVKELTVGRVSHPFGYMFFPSGASEGHHLSNPTLPGATETFKLGVKTGTAFAVSRMSPKL